MADFKGLNDRPEISLFCNLGLILGFLIFESGKKSLKGAGLIRFDSRQAARMASMQK